MKQSTIFFQNRLKVFADKHFTNNNIANQLVSRDVFTGDFARLLDLVDGIEAGICLNSMIQNDEQIIFCAMIPFRYQFVPIEFVLFLEEISCEERPVPSSVNEFVEHYLRYRLSKLREVKASIPMFDFDNRRKLDNLWQNAYKLGLHI